MMYLIHKPNDPPYALAFIVDAENSIDVSFSEDPVPGFEVLGFVKITDEHNIFLTPKVFKWADYENKTRLGKWWTRLPNTVKDFMIAFSFLASLVLAILQILELLKILPSLVFSSQNVVYLIRYFCTPTLRTEWNPRLPSRGFFVCNLCPPDLRSPSPFSKGKWGGQGGVLKE